MHLYKDTFHCCFNFDPIPVVCLLRCYCSAHMILARPYVLFVVTHIYSIYPGDGVKYEFWPLFFQSAKP